jgi:TonB-linked SusC/RagA family outer membrane protein
VVPQFFVEIKPFEGFTWNTKVAFSLYDNFNKGHEHAVDNYFFEDGSYAHNNSTWRLGVTDVNRQTTLTTLFSTLNYSKVFNESHGIDILAGYNQESYAERELRGNRIYFPTNDIKELNAGSTEGQTNYGTAAEWAIQSLFGRIAYNFQSKYLFEVNARYDGTSRIASDTRWGFFPSVSAGWRVSEEGFAKQISWLDNLKLRASWGQLGNQNVGLYPYQEVLSTTSYPFSTSADPAVRQTRMVDPSLQWETTTMTDIGLDIGVKNGLFTATIDWYDKVTDDILYSIPIPASVGLSAPTVNYGKMRNRGYEIELGHGQQLGEFNYNVFFNYSHNENEVLRILAPSYGNTTIQEGLPFNSFYLTEWIGIFQNQAEIDEGPLHPFNPKPGDLKFKDQNGDNKIDADDRIVVDGAYPKFIYGGGLNLSWRNFSLSAFFQGVEGQKLSVQGLAWGLVPYIQGSPPPADFIENMWTPENPTNEHPAMYVSGYAPVTGTQNTYWLLDASYLRLKNLSVEYNFPKILTQKIGLNSLRIYASGDNLFTITKYPGADPERASTGWFEAYPQVSIYTMGVKVKL